MFISLTFLLSINNQLIAFASKDCYDYESCSVTTLSDTAINCYGYYSCYGSNSITSTSGDVNCGGDHGCWNSESIKSQDNVVCGPYACMYADIYATDGYMV